MELDMEIDKDLDFEGYIDHFVAQGFKLAKDTNERGFRVASLRLYTPEDYGEVMLRQREGDTKVSVMLSMNGRVVPFA